MFKARSIAAILLLALALPTLVPSTTAIGNPMIAVAFDQSEMHAAITRDQGEDVTFTGLVQVQMPVNTDTQSVIVDMVAQCGDNWSYILEPEHMVFNRSVDSIPFNLTVHVPTTATYPSEQVSVWAQYRVSPGIFGGISQPAISMITVDQYWGIGLDHTSETYTAEAGRSFTAFVSVENTGNGEDTFSFEVTNRDQFIGWTIATPDPETVDAFDRIDLALTGSVPDSAATGTYYTINVRGTTQGGGAPMTDTGDIRIYVKAPPQDPSPPPPPNGGDGGANAGGTNDTGTGGQDSTSTQPHTLPGSGILAVLFGVAAIASAGIRRKRT